MSALTAWFGNPLGTTSGRPDSLHLFMTVGLVLVFVAAWGILFHHIRAVAD